MVKDHTVWKESIVCLIRPAFLHFPMLRNWHPRIPCGAMVEYLDLGNPGYYCCKV